MKAMHSHYPPDHFCFAQRNILHCEDDILKINNRQEITQYAKGYAAKEGSTTYLQMGTTSQSPVPRTVCMSAQWSRERLRQS